MKFNMTPDPSLLEDIGAGSFTVGEAIAELVANSFDARVQDTNVEVHIEVNNSEIWVIDNGKGMTADELPQRMKLAFKDPEREKSGKKIKGMYGLGLKTACASLGRAWGIYTKAPGDAQTHHFDLDLEEWTNRRGEDNPNWEHETQSSLSFPDSPLNDVQFGTAVYIRKLRDKDLFVSPIMDRLSRAYKPHLEAGDKIFLNGVELLPERIEIRPDSRAEIDALIGPNDEYHITGWLGVGQTSNDSSFGINIYRQGQLVETWNKDWFRAHTMTSRVRGDVNLDFVPSNFHKKGLDKSSLEWAIASEFMKVAVDPIRKLSEALSKDRNDPTRDDRAFAAFNSNLSTVPELTRTGEANAVTSLRGTSPASSPEAKGAKGDVPPSVPGAPVGGTSASVRAEVRDNKLIVGNEEISIVGKVQALSSKERHWDYAFNEENAELLVVLNSASPVYEKTTDLDFYAVLAKADVVTTFLIEKRNWKAKDARQIRDLWLTQHFASGKA